MHDIIPTDHEVIFHKPSVIIRIEQDEDGHLFSLSFRSIQVVLREEKDGGPYFLSLFSHDLHAVFSFTSMINLFQLFGFPFFFVYGYDWSQSKPQSFIVETSMKVTGKIFSPLLLRLQPL